MSWKVSVLKNGAVAFGATFETEQEAKEWIKKQEAKGSWGKATVEMVVTEVVKPMELIEEVKGPMGVKAYKIRLPADYEVVIEEVLGVDDNLADVQRLLTKTDWLFIADVVIEKEYRVEFKKYREYLRKLPRTTKIEEFSDWLKRTRPDYFMEGKQGPDMIKKFKTYL
jgi:hypothetical protein